MPGKRTLLVVLGLLVGKTAWVSYGQEAPWWGGQGKIIGGLGVVAEAELSPGVHGTLGAGYLLLVIDGFAGIVTHTGSPLDVFGRMHLLGMANPLLGGSVIVWGLEPGVRLWLPGRWLAIEGGGIAAPRWEERVAGIGERGFSRRRVLRVDWLPNIGLVIRLGRL
ncbi:MAG: hypothetical protein Q9M35_11540 [Rhodothermus sp.]|nr:hypothetical protein [Rhodothermus sp.]